MKPAYTLTYKTAGAWIKQGDLSKKEAIAAAKALRATGLAAFVFPTASLHLVTFA